MKKIVLLIAVSFIGSAAIIAQNTIPNPGFENWTSVTPNEPVGWGTANAIHLQLNGCATKATAAGDIYSGTTAVILTTVEVTNIFANPPKWRVAGTAVSGGKINLSAPFITGGIPYTLRPAYLNGYCKYLPQQSTELYEGNPVGIDLSNIQVYFTKRTGTRTDTIGQGQLSPSNTTYDAFSVTINYDPLFAGVNPDTVQIILASSKGLETAKGSKLYVDDIAFSDLPLGVETSSLDKFDVKQNVPNPFSGSTTIQFNSSVSKKVTFSVVDLLGREVYFQNINASAGTNTINYTSELTSGTYFYSVTDGTNKLTKRMIVAE